MKNKTIEKLCYVAGIGSIILIVYAFFKTYYILLAWTSMFFIATDLIYKHACKKTIYTNPRDAAKNIFEHVFYLFATIYAFITIITSADPESLYLQTTSVCFAVSSLFSLFSSQIYNQYCKIKNWF